TKRARQYADFYIKPYYAFPVRKEALQILVQTTDSTANWDNRLDTLLTDYDPRIRYLTVKNMQKLNVNTDSVLADHKEYDARVYKEMRRDDRSDSLGVE